MDRTSEVVVKAVVAALELQMNTPATLIGEGQNTQAYALGMSILRVPRHAGAMRELEREAEILAIIGNTLPAAIPQTAIHKVNGYAVSIHARIDGTVLEELGTLNAEEQGQLANNLADFLRALHDLPIEQFAPLATPLPSIEWRALLARFEARVFPEIDAAEAAQMREAFEDFLHVCDTLPRHMIHGDFGTGNILVDGCQLAGVIDFAGCDKGDPAYDFASLAAGLGDAFTELVLERYMPDPGLRQRMAFYRSTFPLLDILDRAEHGPAEAAPRPPDGNQCDKPRW